jgi:hypothetical protein
VSYSIASNSVVQVTLKMTLFNQVVMNTFHYRYEQGLIPITDGAAALSDFNDALDIDTFYLNYINSLPPQCLNIVADLQWIYPLRYVKRSFNQGPVGGSPNATTVSNMAAALLMRGDTASRRSVGTKHIPGVGGATVAAGLLSAGKVAEVTDFADRAILVQMVGDRIFRPIVYGRARPAYTDRHGVLHPALPTLMTPITAYEVETTARVMRRRTVGLGI